MHLSQFGLYDIACSAWKRVVVVLVAAMTLGVPALAQPPNIIVIVAEDFGWGDLPILGNTEIVMPNVEKLASQGTLFTRFYASASISGPTRAALLTGRFPAELGVHRNYSDVEAENQAVGQDNWLNPAVPTVAKSLRGVGYTTAHYGSWKLGTLNAPAIDIYGFDHHRSTQSGPVNPQYDTDDRKWGWLWADQIVDDAISFINSHSGSPFYLQLGLDSGGIQLDPSGAQAAAYDGDVTAETVHGWTSLRHCYYSAATAMDSAIGRLIDELDDQGLSENTVVLFTSTSGPASMFEADKDHFAAGHPGPFRGRRGSLYEGGVRVPLIVRWPGTIPAKRVTNTAVLTTADLYPTLCALAGASAPTLDGEDASPALTNNIWSRSETIFMEQRFGPLTTQEWRGAVSPGGCVISGAWKLLQNRDATRRELYNVVIDPTELDNLADDYPQIASDLATQLMLWQSGLGPCLSCENEGDNSYPWPGQGGG